MERLSSVFVLFMYLSSQWHVEGSSFNCNITPTVDERCSDNTECNDSSTLNIIECTFGVDDCTKFIMCENQTSLDCSCPKGQYFNSESHYCVFPFNGDCNSITSTSTSSTSASSTSTSPTTPSSTSTSPTSPSSTSTSPTSPSSTSTTTISTSSSTTESSTITVTASSSTTTENGLCQEHDGGATLSPCNCNDSCTKYYICYENGVQEVGTCTKGMIFNETEKTCCYGDCLT